MNTAIVISLSLMILRFMWRKAHSQTKIYLKSWLCNRNWSISV